MMVRKDRVSIFIFSIRNIINHNTLVEIGGLWDGYDKSVSSTYSPKPLWKDMRVVLPVTLSLVALILTIVKLGVCIMNRKW